MLTYDQTSKASFTEAEAWYERIKKANGGAVKGVLVATKLDLKQIRQVTENEGLELAKRLGLQFFQVSTARN
jgi:GTPase SAR1 family protein